MLHLESDYFIYRWEKYREMREKPSSQPVDPTTFMWIDKSVLPRNSPPSFFSLLSDFYLLIPSLCPFQTLRRHTPFFVLAGSLLLLATSIKFMDSPRFSATRILAMRLYRPLLFSVNSRRELQERSCQQENYNCSEKTDNCSLLLLSAPLRLIHWICRKEIFWKGHRSWHIWPLENVSHGFRCELRL